MLLERFEDQGLSQYSYVVGCPSAGVVAVVDPRRDVDAYVRYARARDLEIGYVLETHIHADFASGARELAERSGARLTLSRHDEGERYEVAFPHEEIGDGDRFEMGAVRVEALHTPGHTPEHLSFLVYDTARSGEVPEVLLSGDFLFVGSLGRPDLLGEDAKMELARELFASVRNVLVDLPDGLEVHPGHGAGSMCGAGMSGRATSTLGFERVANPYLSGDLDEDRFVERILGSAPPFPDYYRRMKELNAAGPPILDGLPGQRAVDVEEFRRRRREGAVVVDLRDQLAYGAGHVPDSFGIGAGPGLSTWAAWVVPYDAPILLVAANGRDTEAAVRSLVRVGLDDVVGHLDEGIEAWIRDGNELRTTQQITPAELDRRLADGEGIGVLDVRTEEEWIAGRIPDAVHVMGGELHDRLEEVPDGDRPLAVVCDTGYRSTVAASVLERNGFRELINVTGGMAAWRAAGLPLEEPA